MTATAGRAANHCAGSHLAGRPSGSHRGVILIEALVAFAVLAIGLLALLGFHGLSHRINADAKVQAEAVALAEGKLRELESFLTAGDRRLDIGSKTAIVERNLVNYSLSWRVAEHPAPVRALKAEVSVAWEDRDGSPREVRLGAAIDARSPGADVEELLAMVAAGAASRTGGDWVGGSPGGDPGNPGAAEPAPGPGDDDDPPDPGPAPEVAARELTIAGRIRDEAENPAPDIEIRTVSVDAYLAYQAECDKPTAHTFDCKVKYPERSPGWSGEIALTTNGIFCETLGAELTLTFFGITSDQTDITLAVAGSANRCRR